MVSVEIEGRKGPEQFSRDEQPRADTTVETLAKLRPAFRPDGTITAGNAPGLNSGAAAMVVAERGFAEAHGIEPFARLVAYGVAAVEPGMFGLGPVPAVQHGAGARRLAAQGCRARRDQRGLCRGAHRRVAQGSAWRRSSSTSKAARSPTAIRSARPARC